MALRVFFKPTVAPERAKPVCVCPLIEGSPEASGVPGWKPKIVYDRTRARKIVEEALSLPEVDVMAMGGYVVFAKGSGVGALGLWQYA